MSLLPAGICIGAIEQVVNLEADRVEYALGRRIMNRAHAFWSMGFAVAGLFGGLAAHGFGAGCRLCKQRDIAYEMLNAIPGVSCTKPQAAMYLFPRLDPEIYPIKDDQQFILDLLLEEKVLLVQGTGFNWKTPDHFRVVFLPNVDDLAEAIRRISRFLENYRKKHNTNNIGAKA